MRKSEQNLASIQFYLDFQEKVGDFKTKCSEYSHRRNSVTGKMLKKLVWICCKGVFGKLIYSFGSRKGLKFHLDPCVG